MNDEFCERILTVLPKVTENSQELFSKLNQSKDWYESKRYFLEENNRFLEILTNELEKKFNKIYDKNDCFSFQKFYLVYPHELPLKVCGLSFNHIKLLINICNNEKRNFYIELSLFFECDSKTLEKYILNDIYEKFQFLKEKEQIQFNRETLKKIIEIQDLIFE